MTDHVNFRCIYFCLKMVVRPKHVEDNLNKIVNNYWNRVALDGDPWTWSSTRHRMQTLKFSVDVASVGRGVNRDRARRWGTNQGKRKGREYCTPNTAPASVLGTFSVHARGCWGGGGVSTCSEHRMSPLELIMLKCCKQTFVSRWRRPNTLSPFIPLLSSDLIEDNSSNWYFKLSHSDQTFNAQPSLGF
jgi:hypothetical protein